jgi:hypothetical protein
MERISITEEDLKALLDAETWLLPADALEKGFATSIITQQTEEGKAAASARKALFSLVRDAMRKPTEQDPEPTPAPKENKPIKLFNALFERKGNTA